MRYNIVAGEELKKIMLGKIDNPIPFNEDMSVGTYSNEPFVESFFLERSAVHGVSAELYKEKLSTFLNILPFINKDDEFHLYFGDDKTCIANRRLLIGYLSNKVNHIYLHIVNEYTAQEIKLIDLDLVKLKNDCLKEEEIAHIKGWDFSHIRERYNEEDDIPWDYKSIIKSYLKDDMKLLDYDTGGGEFLLSLKHPYQNTSATEGYEPNVNLCNETLLPLGIDFRECNDCSKLPFEDESFDIYINRHGDMDAKEAYRVLKRGGLFITQQVGSENDRDLVLKVLPNAEVPFPDMKLDIQKQKFIDNGFKIIDAREHFGSIKFYDTGAFVWFARIIEWEFIDFSVERCFSELVKIEEEIKTKGFIEGVTHRYLIVAKKE